MEIVIGVDPHKATNVVAAIDEQGELVGQETFPANRKGLRTLQRWAKCFPERRWAVEGAGGIGRPLQRLPYTPLVAHGSWSVASQSPGRIRQAAISCES